MKIRSGFVSNSSSSSYVIVIEKEAFDKMYAELTDLQKDIVSFLSNQRSKTAFVGKKVYTIQYTSGNYSTLENYTPGDGRTGVKIKDDEDNEISYYEIFDEIEEKIEKLPKDSVMKFEQDM